MDLDATYYYYVDSGNGTGTETTPGTGGTNGWQTYTKNDGGAHRNISVGQAFGVVITANTDYVMQIKNTSRTHNTSNGFNKKQEVKTNYFELDAVSNNVIDNIKFQVNNNATENFDSEYDAYKLNSFGYSPTPSFVSADNKKLAVCHTTDVDFIDMGFTMSEGGEVVFSLADVADFTEIVLEDKIEGTFTNLINSSYTFQYSTNDEEFGRFTLHLNKQALGNNEEQQTLKIYSSNSVVYIKSAIELEDVSVTIYDINGQSVYSKKYSFLKEKQIKTNLSSGVYILKITSIEGVTTQKISLISNNQ